MQPGMLGKFSPLHIPGCALWLSARRNGVTLDGSDNVSDFIDLSGNGRSLYQATAGRRFHYISSSINGRPALVSAAENRWFLKNPISGFTSLTGYMITLVIRADSTAGPTMLFRFESGTAAFSLSSNVATYVCCNVITTVAFTNTNPCIVTLWYDGTGTGNTGRCKMYVDGVEQTLNFGAGTIPASYATGGTYLYLGAIGTDLQSWNGAIGEGIFYTRACVNSERQQVERKNGNWYGITVA